MATTNFNHRQLEKVPVLRAWQTSAITDDGEGSGSTVQLLTTLTIPGGVIGANGWCRWECLCSFNSDATSKVIRIRLGPSNTAVSQFGSTNNVSQRIAGGFWNTGSQSSQKFAFGNTNSALHYNSGNYSIDTETVDTSADFDLTVAHLFAAGDSITLEYLLVWTCYIP